MVTTRIIVGPTEGALLESLIGQHKKIIFLTEGNLKFKGVVKTLIPQVTNNKGFNFTGSFDGVRLRGFYDVRRKTGWIEVKPIGMKLA